MRWVLAVFLVGGWLLVFARSEVPNSEIPANSRTVDFNRDIRPILSDNCFTCHGPDDKMRMAGLRFDTREGPFASEGVIVPGNAAASRLIARITAEDREVRMPPVTSERTLDARQIELLRRWIDEGASQEAHWAFVAPQRPELPKIEHASWARNPIDHFAWARMHQEGLQPSPEADKTTLVRRVTFDLTGLPPTPEEVRSFLADNSPDAYEKRVDQLLASPHYGERMAMPWLDLARYADTHGYHIDSHRDMWPWREWVVGAFNRNMPFDQFTVEQLAGDLLPNATIDQKIASGFNRNHMINYEGGAIPEEYQLEYVVDRVETTATTWMGVTMGCARCHSHKYDPITHKEFYQFSAFFNTVSEKGLDGRTGNAEPFLRLPTPSEKTQLEALQAEIKKTEAALSDGPVKPVQEQWEKGLRGKLADDVRDGLVAHYEMNGSLSDVSGHYRHGRAVQGDPTFAAGQAGRSVTLDGDAQISFGQVGSFQRTEPFSFAFWIKPNSNIPMTVLQKIEDAAARRGFEILLEDLKLAGVQRRTARLAVRLSSRWPDETIYVRTNERLLMQNEWHHVVLNYDGSSKASGLKIYLNGKPQEPEILKDQLAGSTSTASELQIGNKDYGKPFKGQIDDLRIYSRPLMAAEIGHLALHHPIEVILSGVNGKASEEENGRVRNYFLTVPGAESFGKFVADLKTLQKQKAELDRNIASVMVMSEMEKPRETFILARGDYRNKTEKVTPGVPGVLPPLSEEFTQGKPPNRLALARWLVHPKNPLTARVNVNRYWQMYFGEGLVKTSENFGSQGEPPTHPELLDWLATEFVRTQWDIRAMQRLIVTSATYRQSSKLTAALLEKDPENRLLARGPRSRLPAEMIRDNALAAGGLLNREIGGRSVFPYQPKGLWEEMAIGEGFSAQEYTPSSGKDLYRRSMYTFWKRTVPPTMLATFDAPDREKCTTRRPLTNTPLQALALMNDPTFVEAARALAQRTLQEAAGDPKRLDFAFLIATARRPEPEERRVLERLLRQQRVKFKQDPAAAAQLLSVGESPWNRTLGAAELAAWTTLASAILNLDETITKE